MAWLLRRGASHRVTIPARCLVGRSPNCTLRPSDRRISGEHATIVWTGESWEVRDLGSRNGTFVNGERLEVGSATVLKRGDALGFGGAEHAWTFADAGPPVATARSLEGDEIQTAEDGLLALPSAEDPRISVFEDLHGGWLAEVDEQSRVVHDGEVISVGERTWMLHLPTTLERTMEVSERAPIFDALELIVAVSSDEEHVELAILHDGKRRELGSRSHHHLVLLLARARIEDAERPDLPEAEQGWRYVEEVCRMLQVDDLRLNTEIYRARRELSALGVQGAPKLVQRRRSSRSLRLGTGSVQVSRSR